MLDLDRPFSLTFLRCHHRIWQAEPYKMTSRRADSLLIYLQGGHDFQIGERMGSAGAGELVYIPRGLSYVNYPLPGPLDYYQVEFTLDNADGAVPLFDDWFSMKPEQVTELLPVLTDIYRLYESGDPRKAFAIHEKLAAVIGAVVNMVNRQQYIPDRFIHIRRAAALIEAEYTLDIPVTQIASDLSISLSALEKGFAELYHCTPTRYRQNCRIEQAKRLLAGGVSVTQAALEVGFSSVYYFSRLFRQLCGVSPSAYARECGRAG